MKHAFFTLALFALAGCVSVQPPSTEAMAKLPVVRVGSQPPQGGEYVVFYPVGFPFSVQFTASGTLFASEIQIESQAMLAKDLYLYKYWASHDGKSWKNSHELLRVEFGGGFDIDGLQSNVKLDAK